MFLPYTLIKNADQQRRYQERYNLLTGMGRRSRSEEEEWELLDLLLRTYRQECHAGEDPVQLLRALLREQGLQARDLAQLL